MQALKASSKQPGSYMWRRQNQWIIKVARGKTVYEPKEGPGLILTDDTVYLELQEIEKVKYVRPLPLSLACHLCTRIYITYNLDLSLQA